MNNEELAKQIITLCGGESNLVRVTNCMTRCRLTVFDASLVEESALKSTEGVLGLISDGDSFQVVLGPGERQKK
ncbi:PTS glucose/sucrose transporter subunit IIB [Treponema phagedenis]|uniref:PTS glucose/sucrose transporter subunit IIB n=1 Tax=Treponema phagedenis TaxID=162 RepID=UPI001C40AF08|nr:PTS glucose/sucrose transporter subunit IIB [Treponema phagedenis]